MAPTGFDGIRRGKLEPVRHHGPMGDARRLRRLRAPGRRLAHPGHELLPRLRSAVDGIRARSDHQRDLHRRVHRAGVLRRRMAHPLGSLCRARSRGARRRRERLQRASRGRSRLLRVHLRLHGPGVSYPGRVRPGVRGAESLRGDAGTRRLAPRALQRPRAGRADGRALRIRRESARSKSRSPRRRPSRFAGTSASWAWWRCSEYGTVRPGTTRSPSLRGNVRARLGAPLRRVFRLHVPLQRAPVPPVHGVPARLRRHLGGRAPPVRFAGCGLGERYRRPHVARNRPRLRRHRGAHLVRGRRDRVPAALLAAAGRRRRRRHRGALDGQHHAESAPSTSSPFALPRPCSYGTWSSGP